MTEHLQELSANGRLSVGGENSQVGYKLVATQEADRKVQVAVSVMAPRDWLLKQGFSHEAVLQRDAGKDLPVKFDGNLDVTDPISVTLRADTSTFASVEEAQVVFPELSQMRS